MKSRKCPYCGGSMEEGIIESPYEIVWMKGTKRHVFSKRGQTEGYVVLAKDSFLSGSAVVSSLCRNCGKVVIDLPEEKE